MDAVCARQGREGLGRGGDRQRRQDRERADGSPGRRLDCARHGSARRDVRSAFVETGDTAAGRQECGAREEGQGQEEGSQESRQEERGEEGEGQAREEVEAREEEGCQEEGVKEEGTEEEGRKAEEVRRSKKTKGREIPRLFSPIAAERSLEPVLQ